MSDKDTDKTAGKTAGALDVRNIIGALLGIYGVTLVLMGIFGDTTASKTGDVNANLWAGLALIAAAGVFLAWARIRPIVVRDASGKDAERPDAGH